MIEEWRKGCSDASNPACCHDCTNGLIDAMESNLNKQASIKKLQSEFEVELFKIKQDNYGFAALALSVVCGAKYASKLSALRESMQKEIKFDFNYPQNYPECLDRIVDAGMKAAEAKILEFKELDRVEREMKSILVTVGNAHKYCGSGGQGGNGIDDLHPGDSMQAKPKFIRHK